MYLINFNPQLKGYMSTINCNLDMKKLLDTAERRLEGKHYKDAFDQFTTVANSSDKVRRAWAQFRLGEMRSEGKGQYVPLNKTEAITNLTLAANQYDNEKARKNASTLLEQRYGITPEKKSAQKAQSVNGSENDMTEVSRQAVNAFNSGHYKRAESQFKRVADSEDKAARAFAQYRLGHMYMENRGDSVGKSRSLSDYYLSQASNQDDNPYAKQQALALWKPKAIRPEIPNTQSVHNVPEMKDLLEKAELDLETAHYRKAEEKFKIIADNTSDKVSQAWAQLRLGQMYKTGNKGKSVLQNPTEARRNLRLAANKNNSEEVRTEAVSLLEEMDEEEISTAIQLEPEMADDRRLQEFMQESAPTRPQPTQTSTMDEQLLQHLEALRTSPPRQDQQPSPLAEPKPFTNYPPAQAQAVPSRSGGRLIPYYERKIQTGTPAEKVDAKLTLALILMRGFLGTKDVERGHQLLEEAALQGADNPNAADKAQKALNGIDNPLSRANNWLYLATQYDRAHESIKARDSWMSVVQENASTFTTAAAELGLGKLYAFSEEGDEIEPVWSLACQYFKSVIEQKKNLGARAEALYSLAYMIYRSPHLYENFEEVYQCLVAASNQMTNQEVASKAKKLLKTVLEQVAEQTENVEAQQKARRYHNQLYYPSSAPMQVEPIPAIIPEHARLGGKRKADTDIQHTAKKHQAEDMAASALYNLASDATTPEEQPASLYGILNLMQLKFVKEAVQELKKLINHGDEEDQARVLKRILKKM